jgi:hypothetical protein
MVIRHVFAWLPMVALAIGNGAARELLYGPHLPEPAANQVSCVTAVLLFSVYALWLGRRWPLASARQAVAVGAVWLGLTLAFEFSMVLLVQSRPLEVALAQYDVASGNLWVLVLAAVAGLPWAVHRLGSRRGRAG